MSKTLKNLFVSVLAALAIISFVAVGGAFNAKAETTAPSAPTGTAEVVAEKIASLDSFEVLGTQVRTVSPLGMRFISVISDADLAKLPADAQFGTLIIPKDILGEGELTLETALAANANAKVGYDAQEVADGFKGYTGVIIGTDDSPAFPESDYAREFVAVGYVTYTYGDGQVDTIYTAKKSAILAKVADTVLKEVGTDDNDTLVDIVNSVMGSTQLSVDNAALKTGETTALNVTGMPEIGIEVQLVENEYVGFDAQYGTVYGKKVGTGKITFEVVSTGATCSTQDITVSAIELGAVDNVEFLLDDNSIDLSAAAETDEVLATALSADGVATVDGASVTVADKKVAFTKPELDTDEIYGDKARVLTIIDGDIEYTVNFNSIVAGFIVDDKAELEQVNTVTDAGDKVWKGYVILNADIDYNGNFSDYQIAPQAWDMDYGNVLVEGNKKGFAGVFDGNGHKIVGLEVGVADNAETTDVDETKVAGFFGQLADGSVVKNVAFVNGKLRAVADFGNAFLARFASETTIDNCFLSVGIVYSKTYSSTQAFVLTHYSASYKYTLTNSIVMETSLYGPGMGFEAEGTQRAAVNVESGIFDNAYAKVLHAGNQGTADGLTTSSSIEGTWNMGMFADALANKDKFNSKCWEEVKIWRDEGPLYHHVWTADATFDGLFFKGCSDLTYVR